MLDQRTIPIQHSRPKRRFPRGIAVATVVTVAAGVLGYSVLRSDADPATRVATVVLDRESGEKIVRTRGDEQFRMASVVKLLIALDAVVEKGVRDKAEVTKIQRMLSASDDGIASTLWSRNGGTDIVTRAVALIGLRHTTPPADRGRWGDTLSTADDIAAVYTYILKLPKAKRDQLLTPLRKSAKVAADGFDQRFGIPSAFKERPVAVKQGWAAGRGAVDAHTTGLVGEDDRYIVVILSTSPEGTGLTEATAAVTASARSLASRIS
ncbi:hypothetical protein [Amycolatopsis sp. NPDC059657]|uniref:hypothetical protein n=1 Tax=Amycolatopsis sp. NPDC059657 TaxID=3346899 RepID=UPI00366CBE66